MGGSEVWGEEEGGPLWGGETFRLHHLHNILQTADHSPSPSPPRPHPCQPSPCVTMTKPPPPTKQPPSTHVAQPWAQGLTQMSPSPVFAYKTEEKGGKKKNDSEKGSHQPQVVLGP